MRNLFPAIGRAILAAGRFLLNEVILYDPYAEVRHHGLLGMLEARVKDPNYVFER